MKKFLNARRTKNNDIVFFSNTNVSLNNIMVCLSCIMVLLNFFSFIKINKIVAVSTKVPYFSPINIALNKNIIRNMLDGIYDIYGNYLSEVATLGTGLFKSYIFLLLVPIFIIIIYFINRNVVKNNKNSYIFLMLSYSFILIGSIINYTLLKVMSTIVKVGNGFASFYIGSIFKISFAGSLYGLFNLIIIILILYGISFTGILKVDEELDSTNIFSKETMQRTSEFAKEFGQNMEVAGKVAVKMAKEVKDTASSKIDEVSENVKGKVEEVKAESNKVPVEEKVENLSEEVQAEADKNIENKAAEEADKSEEEINNKATEEVQEESSENKIQ